MSDPFAAIRPFTDAELRPTIERLLADDELLHALLSLRIGRAAGYFAWILRPVARAYLRRQLAGMTSIHDVQMLVKTYIERMIEETTSGFTVGGLDRLDASQAHLFISNHRDIALDPAFTNYALHRAGHETLRIAIGDNLLKEQYVADLMRLNKCFIVQRAISAPRELLAASRLLAQYIQMSIQQDNAPVWIAQREGRAKSGVDRTEPAIIKMLSLSRDKRNEDYGEHIAKLRIVPVAISYELDPCDVMKARELYAKQSTGRYEKAQQEDVASIGLGISGNKGRVHVEFGTPLGPELNSPAEVAAAIDQQIVRGYRLHPSNLWAYRKTYGLSGGDPDLGQVSIAQGSCSRAEFSARIESMDAELRPFALAGYANSLRSLLELATTP